jgi:hypothetical protein
MNEREPFTFDGIEKALFHNLLMAHGTVLWDYYRDAFHFWNAYRKANEIKESEPLELCAEQAQATV